MSGTQWRTTHRWSPCELTTSRTISCAPARDILVPPLLGSRGTVMGVEEWELLSDECFMDFHGGGHSGIFSNIWSLNTDYFVCPSMHLQEVPDAESTVGSSVKTKSDVEEVGQGTVSRLVYFTKMEEREFMDMKMDVESSPRKRTKSVEMEELDSRDEGGSCNGALNVIVRWGFYGFGAAASICIIFLGSKQKKTTPLQPPQKVTFQIYRDDKRMKKVVHVHHASNLKAAVSDSAMRGARITFGGHYNYDGIV